MILVTGANGFVGSALCQRLSAQNFLVRPVTRTYFPGCIVVGNMDDTTDWSHALQGVDVIVHLAARVHIMNESAENPLDEFRRVNVAATLNLARQAVKAKVKRFIYLSSIKVNGELSCLGKPFTPEDLPKPSDPYGLSKLEAENGLRLISHQSTLETVIIRPPLVYGPGVKANFQTMIRWLYKGLPLPLGAIHNQRSLIALDNLNDLIVRCIDHPAAVNQTFLASDGEDLSTTQLMQKTASFLGRSARLIPVPVKYLKFGASILGKHAYMQRLLGSLQLDIVKSRKLLDWDPPVLVDDALRKTAEDFLRHHA